MFQISYKLFLVCVRANPLYFQIYEYATRETSLTQLTQQMFSPLTPYNTVWVLLTRIPVRAPCHTFWRLLVMWALFQYW